MILQFRDISPGRNISPTPSLEISAAYRNTKNFHFAFTSDFRPYSAWRDIPFRKDDFLHVNSHFQFQFHFIFNFLGMVAPQLKKNCFTGGHAFKYSRELNYMNYN